MAVIINQIKCAVNASENDVIAKALRSQGLNAKYSENAKIYKTSLDARKRSDIHFVHSVYVRTGDEALEKKLSEKNSAVTFVQEKTFEPVISSEKREGRVCIAGFGPAGIFCGLVLAEYGYKPLIFERGGDIEFRTSSVKTYWNGGELDENTNVQFGEGGAGTFSDGKLTTRIKDPLCRYVLEQFVKYGAPDEIMTKAKPHIGTDKLRGVIKAMRERITELGGEVRFFSPVEDIALSNGSVESVCVGSEQVKCSALVLAVGHSARDTFEMLADRGVFMEAKPFSVGARIEHKQTEVEKSLYGEHAGNPLLPKGEYQLSYRKKSGRAAYTFCMCPGGVVVPAASEQKTIVTNGMSEFARDGENANSAVAVSVSPADFGSSPLDGIAFAREIERRAYQLSGGKCAPATTVGGFLDGKPSIKSSVSPSYARGVAACEFRKIFPAFVTDMLEEGLADFSRKMKCFGDREALLTAPETRTSSPVRVTRGERLNSLSADNLFPCGEGAGYAGGIMSAAVDGIRTALEIMSRQAPQ